MYYKGYKIRNERIKTSDRLIPYYTAYLIQHFYNSKTRCDCQKRNSDSYSIPKNTRTKKIDGHLLIVSITKVTHVTK